MQKKDWNENEDDGNQPFPAQYTYRGKTVELSLSKIQTSYQQGTSEKGFVMIGMSVLILTIISLCLVGLKIQGQWKDKNNAKKLCIQQALHTQSNLSNEVNSLVKLNKKAQRTHLLHKLWKVKLAAALAAQNYAAAQLARTKIKIYWERLLSIDLAQKRSFQRGNSALRAWLIKPNTGGPRIMPIKFLAGVAPQYILPPNPLQAFGIWQKGEVEIGNWYCGASIENWRNKWRPRLVEAKYSWN